MRTRKSFIPGLIFGVVTGLVSTANAQTYTWDGAYNTPWSTAGDWSGSLPPPNDGTADIVFSGGTQPANGSALESNVDSEYSVHSITFAASAAEYSIYGDQINLGAGGINMNATVAVEVISASIDLIAPQTWTFGSGTGALAADTVAVNNALTLNVAGGGTGGALVIDPTGAAPITKTGAGTLTLLNSDFSNYTGTFTVNEGALAIYQSTGGSIVNNASVLLGAAYAGLPGGPVNISTSISGPGSVTVNGALQVTLSGNNAYTGATTIDSFLEVGSTAALPAASTVTIGNGGLLVAPTSLYTTSDALRSFFASPNFVFQAGAGIGIDTGTTDFAYSGSLPAVDGFVKAGSSALTFSGGLTFSGATTVAAGSLILNSGVNVGSTTSALLVDGAIPPSGHPGTLVQINSGASMTASSATIGSIGQGTVDSYGGTVTVNGTLSLGDTAGSGGTYYLGVDASGNFYGGSLTAQTEIVGNFGSGVFWQGNASNTVGTLLVGAGSSGSTPTSTGLYTLDGSGTLSATNETIGGAYALGIFAQAAGANIVTGLLELAPGAGGEGEYLFGAGVLEASEVRGGLGTSEFVFEGGTLQVTAATTALFQGLGTLSIDQGASINTNGFEVTMGQALAHNTANTPATDGGLTKLGAGTLTVTGANTYTGNTNVNAGTLALAGTASINDSARVQVSGPTSAQATLTLADAASLTSSLIEIGYGLNAAGTTLLAGQAGTIVQTDGTVTVDVIAIGLGAGSASYSLSGTGAIFSDSVFYVGFSGGTGTFLQTGTSSVNLYQLFVGAYSLQNAVASGSYTLNSGTLSTDDISALGYQSGTGTFTQNGGTYTTPHLLLAVYTPASYAAATGTYNLNGGTLATGEVSGGDVLGSGSATGTAIFNFNGGTLQATGGNTGFFSDLTTANVQAGGAIIDTNGHNVSVTQALVHDTTSGAPALDGGLLKLGLGTLTLTAPNTYTGTTDINAGTLLVTNSGGSGTGTGPVSVNNGGTLGGVGTISGAVAIHAGAVLSPGNSGPGRLSLGSTLNFDSGSALTIELGGTTAGAQYDQIVVGGALTLAGSLSVNTVNGFTLAPGEIFTILDDTSSSATLGTFSNALGTLYTDAAGDTFLINYAASTDNDLVFNDVTLTVVTAVPEPSAWTLLFIGAALLGLSRRLQVKLRI